MLGVEPVDDSTEVLARDIIKNHFLGLAFVVRAVKYLVEDGRVEGSEVFVYHKGLLALIRANEEGHKRLRLTVCLLAFLRFRLRLFFMNTAYDKEGIFFAILGAGRGRVRGAGDV